MAETKLRGWEAKLRGWEDGGNEAGRLREWEVERLGKECEDGKLRC